jgi:hypothetical protein
MQAPCSPTMVTTLPATQHCQTTCMQQPQRVYTTCQQAPIHVHPAVYRAAAPQPNIIVNMPKPLEKCVKEETTYCDPVELSDDEPEIIPEVVVEPPFVGVMPEELDTLKNEIFVVQNQLKDFMESVLTNKEMVKANFLTIGENMKFLADQLNGLDGRITDNADEIKLVREEFELTRQDLMNKINQLGAAIPGDIDMSGILGALEDQIKESGGLNFGDRWRLRFKDDCNKDLFLQDREKKGYYRFRTTCNDRLVDSTKCIPTPKCGCDY